MSFGVGSPLYSMFMRQNAASLHVQICFRLVDIDCPVLRLQVEWHKIVLYHCAVVSLSEIEVAYQQFALVLQFFGK